MKKDILTIEGIPAILSGNASDKIYIYVHGKVKEPIRHIDVTCGTGCMI